MPDGARNGIDKSSDTLFLRDDEEEEEGDEGNGGGVTSTLLPPTMSATSSLESDTLNSSSGRRSRNRNNKAANLLPLSPLSLSSSQPHGPQSSQHFFDLLKSGAMVGERNGNSGQSPQPPVPPHPTNATSNANANNTASNSSRLRLSSGPRDSDYVILVLNQKQRDDDEVNMLIDRLRENGVSCLFMKNSGANNNNTLSTPCAKSPTPPTQASQPLLPLISSSEEGVGVTERRSSSRSPTRSLIKSPTFLPPINHCPEKVQNLGNGKVYCGCLHKCNGFCSSLVGSRTLRQSSSSCSSGSSLNIDVIDNSCTVSTKQIANGETISSSSSVFNCSTKEKLEVSTKTPLILRLPIPALKITPPSTVTDRKKEESLVEASSVQDQDLQLIPTKGSSVDNEVDGTNNKKKRKRRRKYPYLARKPVKKRKFASSRKEEEINELSPPTPTPPDNSALTEEESVTEDKLSPEIISSTNLSPSLLQIPQPKKPTQKSVQPLPQPKQNPKLKVRRGRPKKASLKTLSPKPNKSKSKTKSNGKLSPARKTKAKSSSASSSPLLVHHSPHSNSDDPYVFIPDDDGDDFEPPPIKLFSPRKNGLCSPPNGLIAVPTCSPTSTTLTPNLLTVPTWPPRSRKLSPSPSRILQEEELLPPCKTPLDQAELPKPIIPEEPSCSNNVNLVPEEKVEKPEVKVAEPEIIPAADDSTQIPPVNKKARRKRKNEVSELLTWAISPRPSTPRSTLNLAAFLPTRDNNPVKDKQVVEQQLSATTENLSEIIKEAVNDQSAEILVQEKEVGTMKQIEEKVLPPEEEEPKSQTSEQTEKEGPSSSHLKEEDLLEIQPLNLASTTTPTEQEPEIIAEDMIEPSTEPPLTSAMLLPSSSPLSSMVLQPLPSKREESGKVVKRKRKARSALYYKGKKSKVQNGKGMKNSVASSEPKISSIMMILDEEKEEEGNKSGESETVEKKVLDSSEEKNDTDLMLKKSPKENSGQSEDPAKMSVETTKKKNCLENMEKVLDDISTSDTTMMEPVITSKKENGPQSDTTDASPSSSPIPSKSNNNSELSPKSSSSKGLPSFTKPSSKSDQVIWKIPAIPEHPSSSSTSAIIGATPPTSSATTTTPQIPNSFLDAMQLRRPSYYSLIAGNVRNNMENFLDGRPPTPTSADGRDPDAKSKRRKKPRPRNGFLLHHGDNFPEDPEAPYKLHLATQIILKLNKRRSKFKPKEDKGKSLLSYLKLVPKRVSRTSKQNPAPQASSSSSTNAPTSGDDSVGNSGQDVKGQKTEDQITSVFSGEWVQARNFICNICGQVETDFWDMVHHKGEIHPGIVVTHVELQDLPPVGFRGPPTIPSTSSAVTPTPPPCTKCGTSFNSFPDLHLHIFECAGNTTWLTELKEEAEEAQPQRKKKSRRKRGFNRFKRRLSNTPKKIGVAKLKTESTPQKRKTVEVFKCEFCTREFKSEGWLKNHISTHSLPISIPLDKLKQSLPPRASSSSTSTNVNIMGRRSVVQNLLANGNFKNA